MKTVLYLCLCPESLPEDGFKDSFDQLTDVSVDFLDSSVGFCSIHSSPKLVNPRAGDLEVRDVMVQGGLWI